MVQTTTDTVERSSQKPRKAGVKEQQETNNITDAVLKYEGEETFLACQASSPKSRRKINKPKHYKPSGNGEDYEEHDEIPQSPEDLNESVSSPQSVVQDIGGKSVPENAVHVLTANQAEKRVGPSSSQHAVNIPKPKRGSTGKSTNNKKAKQDSVTVPRKPEDLIKEAMILGQPTVPASKRDAQYRKSYAYKIWKERGNLELQSEPDEEKVMNAAKNKLPPGPLQNQARAAFYWHGNYKGSTPPGFFANGKFYAINPQMIPAIHGRPEIPSTSPSVPPPPSVTTSARAIQNFAIQSSTAGVVSPVGQMVQYPGMIPSSGIENPRQKVIPPNVTVVSQYPKESLRSPHSLKSPVVQPPEVKTPPQPKIPDGTKAVSPVSISQVDVPKNSSDENEVPSKISESCETKTSNATATRSNLVSLMKTSLRQKHSKENVQPLPNMFKGKRKHDNSDKSDGPPSKKTGKPTIFTPLNEQEAERLANDIYDVNLEYFPFQTLAEKAAQSEDTLPETPERPEKTDKVKEIEKVRCLLKDFYDVTFSCTEDPDMQKFDSASRKFGRKNILNHLSLLDRYFAELQKKLDT